MKRLDSVAVIGGGLAGAAFARAASDAGAQVAIFEKSRGLGGRMSTRRQAPFAFDHGAQYFTTLATPFRLEVGRWAKAGVAAPWEARFAEVEHGAWQPRPAGVLHWVAMPTMNAVVKHLSEGISVRTECRIEKLERAARRWILTDERGEDVGAFDSVVVATPAAQAIPLLHAAPALAAAAAQARVAPCWAAMVAFDAALPIPYDAATVRGGPLQWVARNTSKPGRIVPAATEAWVLHATAAWTEAHLDALPEDVLSDLLQAFGELPGAIGAPAPHVALAHRWLYARVVTPVGTPCLWDATLALGACGDWCLGGRVEAAWTSGREMARLWAAP